MPSWVKKYGAAAWHHIAGYFIHYLAISTIAALVTYFKYIRDEKSEPLLSYYQRIIEYVTPLTIAFLTVLVFVLFFLSVRQRTVIRNLQAQTKLLGNYGIRAFSAHNDPATRKADWDLIADDIRRASKHESPLWLLGATGKQTFADRHSPLYECVASYQGPIKVLLLLPESPGFHSRIKKIGAEAESYTAEILDSIEHCKHLRRSGRNIELRLYSSMPIWKMVALPDVLWLQHYAEGKHVDDTPAYGFLWIDQRPTIIDGLRSAFDTPRVRILVAPIGPEL